MELLRAAWVEYERDRARYLAAAMIYYALVSLVPLLLLLLAALGLLLRFSEIAAAAEHQMLGVIEARFGPELPATIRAALDTLQRESIAATAISLAGLFFTASVLFRHLRMSFRAIWKYEPPLVSGSVRAVVRATALEQALALAMVLGGGGLLLAALALIGLTQWLGSALPLLARTGWVLTAVSSSILAAIAFAAMFKVRRRFQSAGAMSGWRRCCAPSPGSPPASSSPSTASSSTTAARTARSAGCSRPCCG
jgi:uncharacterized BrkB/YihY/UPF0761 family membrane protein